MKYILVGLGNPGAEYEYTRHNVGRLAVEAFAVQEEFNAFDSNKSTKSTLTKGNIQKNEVVALLPDTFMNKSGSAVKKMVGSIKSIERVVVVHDDIDLPFGTLRITFGRGSGGHKGVESIIKSVKTKNFVRIRIGVALTTPGGKIGKPKGEQKVYDFLLGEFKKREREALKGIFITVSKALESIIVDGRIKAMSQFN